MLTGRRLIVFLLFLVEFGGSGFAKNDTTLVYLGDSEYYPYEYLDSGKPKGFNIDLIRKIGEEEGFAVKFDLREWNKVDSVIEAGGSFDISDMFYSKGRARFADFSEAISISNDEIFVRRNEETVSSLSDLSGKKVAVEKGSFTETYLREHFTAIKLLPSASEPEALENLSRGLCDAAIVSQLVGERNVIKYNINNLRSVSYPMLPREYAYVVKSGNKDLLARINSGLNKLRQTKYYAQLYAKWINPPRPAVIMKETIFIWGIIILGIAASVILGFYLWSKSLKRQVLKRTLELNEKVIELEAAQYNLRTQKAYFEELFSSSPLGIAVYRTPAEITDWNPAFKKLFGYDEEQTPDKSLFNRLVPDEEKEEARKINEDVFGGAVYRGESRRNNKSGETIDVEIIKSPIYNNGRIESIYCQYIDIRKRRNLENELISAKVKAEEADRLKSEFLAQMSHEIRTPLNVISSYINYIKEEYMAESDEELDQLFGIINSANKRIIRTITALLDMSAVQSGAYNPIYERIDLSGIVEDIFGEFTFIANTKKIDFKLLNSSECFAAGDKYTIRQLLENLIDNALKYTEKGSVSVDVRNNGDGKPIIRIQDTGIGISPEYISKLFEPFSQESTGYTRKYDGNGLGLALCKKYAELNNISISVKSDKGKGSIFTVHF